MHHWLSKSARQLLGRNAAKIRPFVCAVLTVAGVKFGSPNKTNRTNRIQATEWLPSDKPRAPGRFDITAVFAKDVRPGQSDGPKLTRTEQPWRIV